MKLRSIAWQLDSKKISKPTVFFSHDSADVHATLFQLSALKSYESGLR